MIPRTAISALPLSTTFEEAKVAFRTLGYSRMPVYRERLDDVVGIIFRRDLEPYLLEEIVGEINDEYDEEVRSQIQKEGDVYVLEGMLTVRDANRALKLDLPESDGYTTIAGFLLARAGRLLAAGESIDHNGSRFTVDRVTRRRIRRIRLVRLSAQT